MRWAPAIVLVALSGCFFGHCGPTPVEATWTDLALYDALETDVDTPFGLMTHDPAIFIDHIERSDGSHHNDLVRYHGGELHAEVTPEGSDRVMALARSVLENGTPWDDEAITSWLAGFNESRDDEYEAVIVDDHGEMVEVTLLRAPLTLQGTRLIDNLGIEVAHGQAWQSDGWYVGFIAVSKTIHLEGLEITVDALGNAVAEGDWREEQPYEEVQTQIIDTLRRNGFPAPESVDIQAIVC